MKTIATIAALCLSASAAFACPNHDDSARAVKTADKKETPKQEEAPKPDTAKKTDTKAPDKVANADAKKTDAKAPAKK